VTQPSISSTPRDHLDEMLDELNAEPPGSPVVAAFVAAQTREDQEAAERE
jgi:hypothetical protein